MTREASADPLEHERRLATELAADIALARALTRELDFDLDIACALARNRRRDMGRVMALARHDDPVGRRDLDRIDELVGIGRLVRRCALTRRQAQERAKDRVRAHHLDLGLALDRVLARTLDFRRELGLDLARTSVRRRAADLAAGLARACARARGRARTRPRPGEDPVLAKARDKALTRALLSARCLVAVLADNPHATWDRGRRTRLLAVVAAVALPLEARERFVEEQAACLADIDSRWERAVYVLDLLPKLPRLALAARAGANLRRAWRGSCR